MTPDKSRWDRWSWLVGALWAVFLGFPLVNAYTADVSDALRWTTLGSIVVFAGLYMRLMAISLVPDADYEVLQRRVTPYLIGMGSIMVFATFTMGVDTLGMMPFVAASAAFTLTIRWAIGVVVGSIAVTLALPFVLPDQRYGLFYAAIVFSVSVFGLFMRLIEDREADRRELERELDIVGERERVARDVHDVVGHSLTAVTAKAELAERLIDLDPERAREELQQIQSLTRESLAEIRATISGLRVARLADELEQARASLHDAGIEADIPRDTSEVDPRHRIVAAWVLRESVTNVIRHSGASRCTVTLHPDGITIVDDGCGVGAAPEGNGVRGMRERVSHTGGHLLVGAPVDGSGTRIEVRL